MQRLRTFRAQRPLVPFAALSASYFAHIGFFNPYLPLWLKSLGLPLVTIGVLTSLQSLTRLFAPYGWGMLSDHTGQRVPLLRWCAALALVISAGLWVPGGPWWIAAVLLLMFTHTSAMMPMSEAAMAHLVSQEGNFDARRYGRVRLWGSLGFLVTVFVAGAWFEKFGMADFPGWTLITLMALVASTWLLPRLEEGQPFAGAGSRREPAIGAVLRRAEVRWFFASACFHVLAHIAVYVFFSLYLDGLDYSKSTIGMLWAVSVVVEIAWFFTQGRWLPRWPLSRWLLVCAAVMALRMGMTAAAGTWLLVLVVAQMLHALTFAAHHTACIALLSEYFPGRLRGRGQALYTVLAYGLPGVVGALAGGALGDAAGLASVYWAAMVASVLACLCAWQVECSAIKE